MRLALGIVLLVIFAACGGKPPAPASAGAQAQAASPAAPAHEAQPAPPMAGHGSTEALTTVAPIAPAPGGLSIADVYAKRASLAGKEVTVRGQVVKANNQILGRNWIHLQDGSGSVSERTNDLTFTTDAVVKVGDVVTFTGVLATGREIGEGYVYDAIVEQAKLVK